jgi:hypothetical protein
MAQGKVSDEEALRYLYGLNFDVETAVEPFRGLQPSRLVSGDVKPGDDSVC